MHPIIQFRISSRVLPTIQRTKIYKTIICSFSQKEGHGLRVFENRVLRRILDLRKRKPEDGERGYKVRSFIIGSPNIITLIWIRDDELNGAKGKLKLSLVQTFGQKT
jgi:hypothetical protein